MATPKQTTIATLYTEQLPYQVTIPPHHLASSNFIVMVALGVTVAARKSHTFSKLVKFPKCVSAPLQQKKQEITLFCVFWVR